MLRHHLLAGDDTTLLRDAVLSRSGATTLALKLAQVDTIDAGDFGVLIDLWQMDSLNGQST